MPLTTLDPQIDPAVPATHEPQVAPVQLTFTEVGHGYRPGRGLLYSVVAHEIAVFSIFFLSFSYRYVHHPRPADLTQVIDLSNPKQVIYLPTLGGGSEGNGQAGGGPEVSPKVSSAAPARSSKGLSYPGPQPILSDPPKPTNRVQTVLQPALVNPPILKQFTPLPNTVLMANAGPLPLDVRANKPAPVFQPEPMKAIEPPKLKLPASKLPELMASQPDLPVFQPAATPPVETPKLALPANPPQTVAPLAVRKPPKRAARTNEKPVEPPKLEQVSPVPTRGTDLQNLVALSPMPAPPGPPPKLPAGEARGRFAISPEANVTSSQPEPGAKLGGLPSAAPGIGSQTAAVVGNAAGQIVVGAGNGGVGTGTGSGSGSGNGGAGTGAGRGSGVGSGLGEGAGHSSGSGTGAGAGHGGGSFPGITIQGSGSGTGTAGKPTWHVVPQTAYGMTVVSTANSGGGLPDFGIFAEEKVYTVYLDMRQTVEDPAASWTLEYAPLPTAGDANAGRSSSRRLEGLTPPFPVSKEAPQFPAELVERYRGRMIVVYAIMDTRGRLGQMLVVQSPDDRLTRRIVETLNKWVFRPAELKGQPVSVKVLLGIPLGLDE